MKLFFEIGFCLFLTTILSAQSKEQTLTIPLKIPLYILIENPHMVLSTDSGVHENTTTDDANVLQIYKQFKVQTNSLRPGWFESQEIKELQQWLAGGALAGFGAGFIYGIIKMHSQNGSSLFGVERPLVVLLYGLEGGIIGGAVGVVAYLVLEYPWSKDEEP